MRTYRDFSKCPRCGATLIPAKTFNGSESEFWKECPRCPTYVNTYIPQEHQAAVHRDSHKFIGNYGGYGSGKTITSREEFYKHMLITPNGNTLIGANVQSQYEQTIQRDIFSDLPVDFYAYWSSQKQWYEFKNGHRLMFRPFDDPDKLRSYNLSMFIILEASEVIESSFTQLKTRLRNTAAGVPKRDSTGKIVYKTTKNGVPIPELGAVWLKGIIESNPSNGWIMNDVLGKADKIYKHGNLPDSYEVLQEERDPSISVHLTSTNANEFLPDNFVEDNCRNKPAWWIRRYIFGSFKYAEGLVYPNYAKTIIPAFDIPPNWPRIAAHDYGLSDPSVFLFGAIDEKKGILYLYKEVRTTDKSVEELARLFYENTKDIPLGGWVCPPIIDPKSGPKRDYEKKSLADHYLEYGISFIPGQVNLDARIFRLNTYIESGRLKIFDTCKDLIREFKEYKFKEDRANEGVFLNKPVDKNNHGINAAEWIVMELPSQPMNLVNGAYDRNGVELTESIDRRREYEKREEEYRRAIFQTEEDDDEPYYTLGGHQWNL